jgi:hypothetical protein
VCVQRVWYIEENIHSSRVPLLSPPYRNRWLRILHSSVNDIELTLSSDFFSLTFFYGDLKHDPSKYPWGRKEEDFYLKRRREAGTGEKRFQ